MPGQSGLEAARVLSQEIPAAKILIMSQPDPTLLLPRAVKAGAHACVDKNRPSTDLLSTVWSVARSGCCF